MSLSGTSHNLNYAAAVLLFLIGIYAVTARPNPVKKVMGLVIMETAVFLFLVSLGLVGGGEARVVTPGFRASTLVNPVPQVIVFIGIVIAAGTVALALSMCVRIYREQDDLDHLRTTGTDGP